MDDDTTNLFINEEEEEEEEEDYCNWSELHEDMIHLIFKSFTTELADYIRFGSVCVSWRSIQFPCLHPDLLHPQLPLLMIPTPPPTHHPKPKLQLEETRRRRSFYRVSERSVYKDLQINLPYNRYCRGSSHGWIITSGKEEEEEDGSSTGGGGGGGYPVELFNPFISVNNEYKKIQLPPLTAFPESVPAATAIMYDRIDYLYKAIVSLNPTSHPKDYVVMAIYGQMGGLGFWRPGDQVWTRVHLGGRPSAIDDVIYHKGLFYAVNAQGVVMVIDDLDAAAAAGSASASAGAGAGVRKLTPVLYFPGSFKKYLVESEGDLLLVSKSACLNLENNRVFRVLKLIISDDDQQRNGVVFKWEVLNTLPGGRMLFLGNNASISLAASDFPGGKSSCIYFNEDEVMSWEEEYQCTGIFSMKENKMIEKLDYIYSADTMWVEPALRCCFSRSIKVGG